MQHHRPHGDEPVPLGGWMEKPPPATSIIDQEWCKITVVGVNGTSQKSWKNKFTGNHGGFQMELRCMMLKYERKNLN